MSSRNTRTGAVPGEARLRFPERVEYVISADAAEKAIRDALRKTSGFRDKDIYLVRDVVGAISPSEIRELISCLGLDQKAFSYQDIVRKAGNIAAVATFLGSSRHIEIVRNYYRLVVIPFMDLKLREKVDTLSKKRPFAWKIQRHFYSRLLHSVEQVLDNLINLVMLAWTFNPGIGEPGMATGFYNRFVFGRRCGFLDLGHFFNCAIVSYLYGPDEARQRGENMEISQRRLRQQEWLKKLRQFAALSPLTDLFWGFATSADTIEDRSSDWFGIELGKRIREQGNNAKIIDYFIRKWPELVKDEIAGSEKVSWFRNVYDTIKSLVELLRYRIGSGARFDIPEYMENFFKQHDAVDPHNSAEVAPGLLEETISFYFEKYNSDDWEKYVARQWQVVIPQDLWEQVVRDKWKEGETELPIKIQLKDNGEKVEPYFQQS